MFEWVLGFSDKWLKASWNIRYFIPNLKIAAQNDSIKFKQDFTRAYKHKGNIYHLDHTPPSITKDFFYYIL